MEQKISHDYKDHSIEIYSNTGRSHPNVRLRIDPAAAIMSISGISVGPWNGRLFDNTSEAVSEAIRLVDWFYADTTTFESKEFFAALEKGGNHEPKH